jgi:hypothetical protein
VLGIGLYKDRFLHEKLLQELKRKQPGPKTKLLFPRLKL